jgi:FtsP/CotA-like multicopper oxidase with cupredoxin domain
MKIANAPMRPKVSRRNLLRLAAAAPFSYSALRAQAIAPFTGRLTPFVDRITPPVAKTPVNIVGRNLANLNAQLTAAGQAPMDSNRFQKYASYPAAKFYDMTVGYVDAYVHSDLQRQGYAPSKLFSYGGSVPGPLLQLKYGEPVVVRWRSLFDPNETHTGFGVPKSAIHLHNMHAPSISDGYPEHFVSPGETMDYHWPMMKAGNDPLEALGSLWYHDHMIDFTAPNVTRGLFGPAKCFDALDTGVETTGLCLPAGARGQYDIPLFFHDPLLNAKGQVDFDQNDMDGVLGNTFAVNGKITPFLTVEPRKYRFRIYTPGPTRVWHLQLADAAGAPVDVPFFQISTDGNLLPKPFARPNGIELAPAQRFDFIVDFSKFAGKRLYFANRMVHEDPRKPDGLMPLAQAPKVLEIRVAAAVTGPDASQFNSNMTLRNLPPLPSAAQLATLKRRSFKFDRSNGRWTINGELWDATKKFEVLLNSAEIWTLEASGNWWHPVHMHFEEGRILTVNGANAQSNPRYMGRRDMYVLEGGTTMDILLKFRDFTGDYVSHCHNVVHEDHAMMHAWTIVEKLSAPAASAI